MMKNLRLALFAAFAAVLAACETTGSGPNASSSGSGQPPASAAIGLYELRTYTAAEGKFGDLVARIRDHEAPLFRKHGMTTVGFFTPTPGPGAGEANRVYLLLGYRDRESRDASWTDFADDPVWKEALKASQANGALQIKIDNLFLTPAEYSPKLSVRASSPPRQFELRTYTANPGKLEAIHARFRDHTIDIFNTHQMTSVLYWRPLPGQGDYESKMVYLMAYPSLEARNASWKAFSADPEWQKVAADSQKDGALLKGAPVSVMLTPTSFSPLR